MKNLKVACFFWGGMKLEKAMNSYIRNLFHDSVFYKNLCRIALPIALQNLIGASLNMVSTFMVGKLGEREIAAVGIANQHFLLFNFIILGLFGGCAAFISQFWGKRDTKNIRKVLGLGLISGISISIIFTIAALLIPERIIAIFNTDKEVIRIGSSYLKIACFSYIFVAITNNYIFSLRCVEKAAAPMIISGFALFCNGLITYTLVFGNFGFNAMGVEGAAVAIVISRAIETSILLTYIYSTGNVLAAKFNELIGQSKEFIKKITKTVIPVIINEVCWGLGIIVYSVAYARIGTGAMASIQIGNTIQNLFIVVALGMASASVVMIGSRIGANDESTGIVYAKKFGVLSALAGVLIALLLAISVQLILPMFNISGRVYHDTSLILYIIALSVPVKTFNIVVITGILRAGGDTNYSLALEAMTMWLIGVPLAFIGVFLFNLPVYVVAALVTIEEIVKLIFALKRLTSNKWVRNLIHNM